MNLPPSLVQAEQPAGGWKTLPLITDGKVDPSWKQIGWGGFVVDGDALRTECVEQGMGLLLYTKEKFGDCQIRVLFRPKNARSNAGVFVRIDDGILEQGDHKPPAVQRDAEGKLSAEMLDKLKQASEKEIGPWYAVHHGYEVQILNDADRYHRTGAIYSLARAQPLRETGGRQFAPWHSMVITLQGNRVLVDLEGQRVTEFDPESPDVPRDRQWYEPKRESKRPTSGYLGLQNHDPGDVVWFKEISVRPLK